MFKIIYLPTAKVVEYPKDFKNWFRPNSPYAEDVVRRFLEANTAYQSFVNEDDIWYMTYDELIALNEVPGKKVPKHLLEIIEVPDV